MGYCSNKIWWVWEVFLQLHRFLCDFLALESQKPNFQDFEEKNFALKVHHSMSKTYITVNGIRQYCCGDYQNHLSDSYLECSKDNENLRFLVARSNVTQGKTLIRVYGMRLWFWSSVNRKIEIIFSKDCVENARCSCPGEKRSTECSCGCSVEIHC